MNTKVQLNGNMSLRAYHFFHFSKAEKCKAIAPKATKKGLKENKIKGPRQTMTC